MAKSAKGQITIVDLNDGKTLSLYLRSSKPTNQIYNVDNKQSSPEWTVTDPMKIYPELYVSGSATNVVGTSSIKSITWKINGSTILSNYNAEAHKDDNVATNNYLAIKANMKEAQYRIECTIVYYDASTGLDTTAKATLALVKNDTTGSSIRMNMYTPNGYTFNRNAINPSEGTDELVIKAEMWRGGSIDDTDVVYTWYQDAIELTNDTDLIKGTQTGTLTVKADAVENVSIFRCKIVDQDQQSATYGQSVEDAVTLYDMTDPIAVEITSTTGSSLTSSAPNTTLSAILTQNGEFVDTAKAIYNTAKFCWKMYDKDGVLVKWWKVEGSKAQWVSKTAEPTVTSYSKNEVAPALKDSVFNLIYVTKADITNRATIICEATEFTI